MSISQAIRAAVEDIYPTGQQHDVLEALSTIPEPREGELLCRPPAEFLQAAVLMLALADRSMLEMQLMNACIEPRDVIYALQSPSVVEPGLTCNELVNRYRKFHLPVPEVLI